MTDIELINPSPGKRKAVSSGIIAVIALIHIFRLGSHLPHSWQTYYYSYFSDIAVPFGIYFLLCLSDDQIRLLGNWYIKAIGVFGLASIMEISQAFGIPVLGQTFDPLDFLMFAIGVLSAALFDRALFYRLIFRLKGKKNVPNVL
jgi:hypothetical protein